VIETLSHGRAPRWLEEGLAAHVAGEGAMLSSQDEAERLSIEDLEQKLTQPASAEEMRVLYAAAYREVAALIRTEGEASVWQRVSQS
jgi:transposase